MSSDSEELEWLSDYVVSILKSPTWVVPIADFVDTYCFLFDDSEENKFEYTTCHHAYRELVDDLFVSHLLDISVQPEHFEALCQKGLAGKELLHNLLVEQLLSVEDFLTFKAMMLKRTVDLDRQAAMELVARVMPDTGEVRPPPDVAACEGIASLSHSSEEVTFVEWPTTEDCLAWHDREHVYRGVPEEMLGASLFAGPHKSCPTGTLSLTCSIPSTVYLMYENSGERRDGGFRGLFKALPDWVLVGGTQMAWVGGRHKAWMSVWMRTVPEGTTIQIPMEEPWVGSIAVKPDNGDWRLYEQQEVELKAVDAGKPDVSSDLQHAMSLSQEDIDQAELDSRLEQAEIEKAIALSLQAEEERVRLEAQKTPEEAVPPAPAAPEEATAPAAPEATAPAAPEATEPEGGEALLPAEEVAPAPPPPAAPETEVAEVPSAPEVEAEEAPQTACATSAAPPPPEEAGRPEAAEKAEPLKAPSELRPVIPRMMRLQPLATPPQMQGGLPACSAPMPSEASSIAAAEAAAKRERAERVSMAAPVRTGPSDEEKRQRAEHLKRQRDLLMQKRAAQREQQLLEYQQSGAGTAAAVDKAMSCLQKARGGSLASELAGGSEAPAAAPDTAAAAQQMRRALNAQLRQSLSSAAISSAQELGDQLEKLEGLKQ
eukprot:TRINITY_DN40409_c0_g1_i1.p1 TRINITY_DN40409_c0_g1~~TRINITY_DN40409_c0_g1_i1.p1  ORF type:complete len:657 (+),score=162.17 TRINITY_DN40409_c0_g1_i1:29-1999(+)